MDVRELDNTELRTELLKLYDRLSMQAEAQTVFAGVPQETYNAALLRASTAERALEDFKEGVTAVLGQYVSDQILDAETANNLADDMGVEQPSREVDVTVSVTYVINGFKVKAGEDENELVSTIRDAVTVELHGHVVDFEYDSEDVTVDEVRFDER